MRGLLEPRMYANERGGRRLAAVGVDGGVAGASPAEGAARNGGSVAARVRA
jgi:hypothetical protein